MKVLACFHYTQKDDCEGYGHFVTDCESLTESGVHEIYNKILDSFELEQVVFSNIIKLDDG